MKHPNNTIVYDGKNTTFTWYKTKDFSNYHPITQAYGIIFNKNGEILICRALNEDWGLPGGTPEGEEPLLDTLKREVLEEVDATIIKPVRLGVQKVAIEDEPSKTVYQARYVARIGKLLPQTVEPDSGNKWRRKLIPSEKINSYIKWGMTGKAIFKDAVESFNNLPK